MKFERMKKRNFRSTSEMKLNTENAARSNENEPEDSFASAYYGSQLRTISNTDCNIETRYE